MNEGKPIDVGDEDFDREVLESNLPVLVDFWAPWCEPCRTAAAALERIARTYRGRVKVCKLNVTEGRQTAIRYHVMSIPILYFFREGKIVDQIAGVTPRYESDIRDRLEAHWGKDEG